MLEIQGLCKKFGNHTVVREVSLSVREGEFLCLLGPSGCGKTTLLRLISGLESPSQGNLLLNGTDLLQLAAHLRPVHTVFQSYLLFPHLSVEENILFPLKILKTQKHVQRTRLKDLLALVKLEGFENRYPQTLSGGQQQRVALARALADHPKILLLDEPFSALDPQLRSQMQQELRSIQKKVGLTFIFVTHDQDEAFTLADRIALMNEGAIVQVGTPGDIYLNPINSFAANFIGRGNWIDHKFYRPECIRWSTEESTCPKSSRVEPGIITEQILKGSCWEWIVETKKGRLFLSSLSPLSVGQKIWTYWDQDAGKSLH